MRISIFAILKNVFAPNTLKEINNAKEHLSPHSSEIVERFEFQMKLRKQEEVIADFLRDLSWLSK